ncbi:hypothetical protein [Methylococcus mesophilus]|uniref:hypothetical protein n=1 Tax=Methylococcus mesophilus TaxID=2993564 RepID=UPI00224B95D7|nr:hypothetical protein [Methylococcus mesophilus]UZR29834.1 hypothetical protein OOT43_04160 [Methylococcus mesophilus]
MGVLTHVVNHVPGIAWALLSKLLPEYGDISHPTVKPKFRECENAKIEVLTYGIVWESEAVIIDLALKHAGTDADRWGALIHRISRFQPAPFEKALIVLDSLFGKLSAEERFGIWDALRQEANRHHTFSDAEWGLSEGRLARLNEVVSKYQPNAPLLANIWLFDEWLPHIPNKSTKIEDPTVAIDHARREAILAVYRSMGVRGLMELAKKAKFPQLAVASWRSLDLSLDDFRELLRLSLDGGESTAAVRSLVIRNGAARFGTMWIDVLRAISADMNLVPERKAELLVALEDSKETWDIVHGFGEVVEEVYWKQKRSFPFDGTTEDLEFAMETYLSWDRPFAAIEASIRRLGDVPSESLMRLLTAAIPEINASKDDRGTVSVYYIEEIFDELEKRCDVAAEDLARMELAYVPFLGHRQKTLTLHRLMVQDARIYMRMICAVYEPAGGEGERRELSDGEMRLAKAAYEVLHELRVLPGQSDENIDFGALSNWCFGVRELAEEMDRKAVVDFKIGTLLAHSPPSSVDQVWPHEAVRAVIEQLASDKVERGLMTERYNMRGVYTKAFAEGGDQERALAQQARQWANAIPDSPRTAAMLIRIAEGWDREANDEDVRAKKEALRH